MEERRPIPEFLHRDDVEGGAWNVTPGLPQRGIAKTNINQRHMVVPILNTEQSRVIRAHEMAHAKLSTTMLDDILTRESATKHFEQSFMVAEELRVNQYIKETGFDVDLLVDGSEKNTMEQLLESDMNVQAVTFYMSTVGTALQRTLTRVLNKHRPELGKLLRPAIKDVKHITKELKNYSRSWSTEPDPGWGNKGTSHATLRLQRAIMNAMQIAEGFENKRQSDEEVKDSRDDREDPEKIGEEIKRDYPGASHASPNWCTPIWGHPPLSQTSDALVGRKRRSSNMGKNPNRMHRALTDPQKRIFSAKRRAKGGMYVVDMSGSRSITPDTITNLLQHAPAATIIGYTCDANHDTPNIWLLADKGRYTTDIPDDSAGNSLDYPALLWAVANSSEDEPRVWISDGQVLWGCSSDTGMTTAVIQCFRILKRGKFHGIFSEQDAIELTQRLVHERVPPKIDQRIVDTMAGMIGLSAEQLALV